ncbi:MAG: ABC transporter ATP-binding protein [Clostridia bacterium]|nr:ABC transporter ATP-binding protein [Clostridia bacterium]
MEPFVSLNNISHVYQDLKSETYALCDINLSISKGEFIAIIGPSGCGKTTLLSILSGMIEPTQGTVTVNGRPASECDVGYMLQHDHLFEWQTIESNALLGLRVRHKLSDENRKYAHELLTRYGLEEFCKAYPTQLSGGMRQKAALIRTLALRPEMMLLDEPFSALDFQTRLTVADEVGKIIRSEGKTAILVTHDITEAISLADKVVVLSKRPARILKIHDIDLPSKNSLERRTDPGAGEWFDILWRELYEGSVDEK